VSVCKLGLIIEETWVDLFDAWLILMRFPVFLEVRRCPRAILGLGKQATCDRLSGFGGYTSLADIGGKFWTLEARQVCHF
jgi:hypothetical protein